MKLVVNNLDNELCSSKARINSNRNKIGHVVKPIRFFLTLFNGHVVLSLFKNLSLKFQNINFATKLGALAR